MNCPNGDGQLHKHTVTDHGGLSITYYQCPSCEGYWMDAFNANFLKKNHIRNTQKPSTHTPHPHCPVCTKTLTLTHGENIPPSVNAWSCPGKHGYYFGGEDLRKFKEAQEAKIAYHKLWSVPLSSVASVLLAGFGAFLLTGGVLVTFRQAQERQSIQSQAEGILLSQKAIINAVDRSVTFLVTTGVSATVTVSVNNTHIQNVQLTSTDGTTHIAQVADLSQGHYFYTFTITTPSGSIHSEDYPLILVP